MGRGRKQIVPSDIGVERIDGNSGSMQILNLELSDSFVFGLARSVAPREELTGFGFTAKKTDAPTFSWEWFRIEKPGEAVKLQEKGRLALEVIQNQDTAEVVRTEFLTDVSLRIMRFPWVIPFYPHYRISILEGSWIRWPSSSELDSR